MAIYERFVNNAVTALTNTITAGATSLTVDDASPFPTQGNFRILVEQELMLVTAISGSTFTVIRGIEIATAAAHVSGVAIKAILTDGSLVQHERDFSNPFSQNMYAHRIIDKNDTPLSRTDFTWDNQGSAVDADNPGGSFFFTVDSTVSDSVRLFERTLTAPWKVTAAIVPLWMGGSFPGIGIHIRDNGVGNFKTWGMENQSWKHNQWTNTTTSSSTILNFTTFGARPKIWLQLEDDNVDHFMRISIDGINFLEVQQETRTTYTATPDRVGLFINNFNTTNDILVDLVSWVEE